jgi:flagellar biosynthetic protein FlhB
MAKGRNLLAEEIKAEARWAGVPIIENPPLARTLYRSVEVGQPIPVDLYAAVAAILAYLYRQRVEAEVRERRARETAARAQAQARAATGFRRPNGGDSNPGNSVPGNSPSGNSPSGNSSSSGGKP